MFLYFYVLKYALISLKNKEKKFQNFAAYMDPKSKIPLFSTLNTHFQ